MADERQGSRTCGLKNVSGVAAKQLLLLLPGPLLRRCTAEDREEEALRCLLSRVSISVCCQREFINQAFFLIELFFSTSAAAKLCVSTQLFEVLLPARL